MFVSVRGSLVMTLVSAVVVLILTVLGARACAPSSATSPSNPVNVACNGVAALNAEQQATAAAGGTDSGVSIDPNGLRALQQAAGVPLACPSTTTAAP